MTTASLEHITGAFWDDGYVVADNLLDAGQLSFARMAMDASLRAGRFRGTKAHHAGGNGGNGANEYSAIGAEVILRRCQPAITAIVGRDLVPTYAFWRIYRTGGSLGRHIDRDACEVSVSIPIFADPVESNWPIHLRDFHGTEYAVPLSLGAGVVYQGCRVQHWREPFPGERQYQLFLHYVIKDGERAAFAFDGRDGPGLEIDYGQK